MNVRSVARNSKLFNHKNHIENIVVLSVAKGHGNVSAGERAIAIGMGALSLQIEKLGILMNTRNGVNQYLLGINILAKFVGNMGVNYMPIIWNHFPNMKIYDLI